MCLLGLALGVHPSVPFICVHNRDESTLRPTAPPALDNDMPFLGGVDLKAGGTWMGLNVHNGSFAALTNYRSKVHPNPSPPVTTSRGVLLQRLLREPEYARSSSDIPLGDEFTGFTMVSAQLMASSSKVPDVRVLSNRPQPKLGDGSQDYSHSIMRSWKLPPGVHSLSNSHFNDRSWPKVAFLADQVRSICNTLPTQAAPLSNQQVLDLARRLSVPMSRQEPFAESTLPDVAFSTLPPDIERALQRRPFQPLDEPLLKRVYATRAQTIVVKTTDAVHMLYRVTDEGLAADWLHFRRPLEVSGSPGAVVEQVFHSTSPRRQRREACRWITATAVIVGFIWGMLRR